MCSVLCEDLHIVAVTSSPKFQKFTNDLVEFWNQRRRTKISTRRLKANEFVKNQMSALSPPSRVRVKKKLLNWQIIQICYHSLISLA